MQPQKQEQQYNNNESEASNTEAKKSLDRSHGIVRTMLGPDNNLGTNSITISWSELKRNMNHKGFGKAVFFMYKNMENIFKPTPTNLVTSSFGSFENSGILLSHIISASLGRGHNAELDHPVIINFEHIQNVTHINPFGVPVCVSWNSETDNWSEMGCRLLKTNRTMSVCECNYLANFALLLQNRTSTPLTMTEDNPQSSGTLTHHIFIAELITYIAVALSIILIVIILFKVRYRLFYLLTDAHRYFVYIIFLLLKCILHFFMLRIAYHNLLA